MIRRLLKALAVAFGLWCVSGVLFELWALTPERKPQ